MSAKFFGRRQLLAAAGSSLFVPAFLQSAFADPEKTGPRLLLFMQACGTHQAAFWPDALTKTSPILEPILSQPGLAQKTLVIKGISNLTGGGLGNQHDLGFAGLWSGVDVIGKPEEPFAGGPSIDQQLKRALAPAVQFPTLNLGALASGIPPKCAHRRSFSYLGPAQPIPTQTNPYRVYATLFPSQGSAQQPPAVRVALRKSALDYAARDLSDLSARLGPHERQKLEAHQTALREYELRLSTSLSSSGICVPPTPPPSGFDPKAEADFPQLAELMLDLAAVALSCNLTRIITFPFGLGGNQMRYGWLGVDRDSHDEVAHHDAPDNTDPFVADSMVKISRWTAEHVSRLARALDAVPEERGTALDSSLVVWANENSTGVHGMDDIPVVLLGRAAGRLTRSGLVDQGRQTHYQLGTSVLNLMGVPAAGFGVQPSCGPLAGLV